MVTKRRSECFKEGKLTTINGETLMSDGEFMYVDRIKSECDCSAQMICISIIEKMNKRNWVGASLLLDTIIK